MNYSNLVVYCTNIPEPIILPTTVVAQTVPDDGVQVEMVEMLDHDEALFEGAIALDDISVRCDNDDEYLMLGRDVER